MNAKSRLFSRFAITAIAAGSLCATATVWAQMGASSAGAEAGNQSTDVSSNPYLRHPAPNPKSTATSKASKQLSAKDQKFLTSALSSGVWEVDNGKAAESKAHNASTKNVASRLVSENSRMNQEIVELAKKKGLGLSPSGPGAQKFHEENFDKNYLTLVKQDHQENIRVFEKEAKSGDDHDLKNLAAGALPTLKRQLAEAEGALGKAK